MQADVLILGAAGFGGGELLRLLSGHPTMGRLRAVSRSKAGQALTDVHPHLHALAGQRFEAAPDWGGLQTAGAPLVVFSAMQHRELAAAFAELRPALEAVAERRRLVFIDLSGDFRLDTAARYSQYNEAEHPCPQYLADFVYGLPEQNRAVLRGAQWIASPGCFATALCLSLLPLSGLSGLGLIALSGTTGSSGSGIRPSAATHHPARANDYRAYGLLKHRHLGEAEVLMERGGAQDYALSFVAHSAPLVRGIFLTAQFLVPEQYGPQDLIARFEQRYSSEPFVRLVKGSPRVATVVGSNYAEIGLAVEGRRLAVLCALDNLGKGMAGQAIQSLNIALGLDERSGLAQSAVYP